MSQRFGSLSDDQQHLSRIATQWTVIVAAHRESGQEIRRAQSAILDRYCPAIYRYLLGAVRDPLIAEELSHEFAVRFLTGDFHRVTPERGRFRDYVRKVLINLVNDLHRERQRAPLALSGQAELLQASPEQNGDDDSFECEWRAEILKVTWDTLKADQEYYHDVLRARADSPDSSSTDLAKLISTRHDKAVSAASVRKTLQRARTRFAELLVDQVQQLSGLNIGPELEAELRSLRLFSYCRSVFIDRGVASR